MKRPATALVIMAKAPEAGNVKTRLGSALAPHERLALYETLVADTVSRLRAVPGVETFIDYAPASGGEYFGRFGLPAFAQEGGDIGARMLHAIRTALGLGFGMAIVVGVDIPDLDARVVSDAAGLLRAHDLVLGPAMDGGYYLVGMSRPHEEIFRDVPWSTDRTLAVTLDRARALRLSVGMTPVLRDLDRPEDLAALMPGVRRG